MCVVIAKPRGSALDTQTLHRCWIANNQGAGVSWSEKGKLFIEKGFMDWDTFKDFWDARDWTEIACIVHFRIATHGGVNEENTHPFWVFPGQLAFAHNGMMDFTKEFSHISDTQVFNRYILKQLPRNFLSNSGIRLMMEDYIGQSNKLVFLNRDGELSIINEDYGSWEENGCWFSNSHWKIMGGRGWVCKDYEDRGGGFYDPADYYTSHPDIIDEDRDHDLESKWEQFKADEAEAEDVDDLDEFIPCNPGELPPFLMYDEWFCYGCKDHFTWTEAGNWYRHDGDYVPECPVCLSPHTIFGIGDDGIWVDKKFISGKLTDDQVNDYLDYYEHENKKGGSEDA